MDGDLEAEFKSLGVVKVTLLAQGAEAKICALDLDNGNKIVAKTRVPKKYRIPELENRISSSRFLRECKIIKKLSEIGVNTPKLISSNSKSKTIYIEYIDGITAAKYLDSAAYDSEAATDMASRIGRAIAMMHDANFVHGDLTMSNVILRSGMPTDPVIIDFGLSETSSSIEPKVVDLHLCERALESVHPSVGKDMFRSIFDSYLAHTKFSSKKAISARLDAVRLRGRKL